MKSILLSGNVTPECEQYPEIDINSLNVKLSMFRSKHKYNSIADVRKFFKDMTQEVRSFFDEVQTLLRILLVNPPSSCSAERSFSSLKTWLRSTMTQKRLNSVALCHIHQEILDTKNYFQESTTCAKILLMIGFTFFIFLFLIKFFSGGFFS